MKSAEEIQDDIQRMDYSDPEINKEFERLRGLFKAKGIPYHELLRSKYFGTVKYLLVELHDDKGTVLITDLDTNNTFSYADSKRAEPKRDTLRDWIRKTNS